MDMDTESAVVVEDKMYVAKRDYGNLAIDVKRFGYKKEKYTYMDVLGGSDGSSRNTVCGDDCRQIRVFVAFSCNLARNIISWNRRDYKKRGMWRWYCLDIVGTYEWAKTLSGSIHGGAID